jgi:hypothetical protein
VTAVSDLETAWQNRGGKNKKRYQNVMQFVFGGSNKESMWKLQNSDRSVASGYLRMNDTRMPLE